MLVAEFISWVILGNKSTGARAFLFLLCSPLLSRSFGPKPEIVFGNLGFLGCLMPLAILCQGCGAILYEGEEIKPPYELLSELNGRCPVCNRRLSRIPQSFEVKSMEENELIT